MSKINKQISGKEQALLTKRELQIAQGLLGGERVSTLANNLCLSKETIRHHLKSIFQKFGVHSQSELVNVLRGSVLDNLPVNFSSLSDMEAFIKSSNQRLLEHALLVGASEAPLEEKLISCALDALPITDSRRFEWIVRLRYWNESFSDSSPIEKDKTPQIQALESSVDILSVLVEQGVITDKLDTHMISNEIVDMCRSVAFRILNTPNPDIDDIIEVTKSKVRRLVRDLHLDPEENTKQPI